MNKFNYLLLGSITIILAACGPVSNDDGTKITKDTKEKTDVKPDAKKALGDKYVNFIEVFQTKCLKKDLSTERREQIRQRLQTCNENDLNELNTFLACYVGECVQGVKAADITQKCGKYYGDDGFVKTKLSKECSDLITKQQNS